MYLDLDLNLVHLNAKLLSYNKGSEASWLDPIIISLNGEKKQRGYNKKKSLTKCFVLLKISDF